MAAYTYLAYDYPLLSAFWTMLWFFLWIMWFVLLFK
ncbi:SHOCT domain-containing protein, partial [Streptomyces sp. NPDC058964]